jgi:formylglycine-generating enzyme required for sulfatase activity
MEINIRLNLGLPKWVARGLVLAGIPAVLALGMSALARADTVTVPHFNPGDKLKAQDLNDRFDALAAAINNPDPACPRGYARAAQPAASFLPNSIVCAKGKDEVVKVGTGASAFWVDRYEASAWSTPGAQAGTQIADNSEAAYAGAGLPKNGQGSGVYALSVANVKPSRVMTWFQAVEMCAASGKQLPDGQQWLRAARGTFDPGSNDGALNPRCNTSSTTATPRNTALGVGSATDKTGACTSDWGAEDMVGNLFEWTTDWYAGLGNASTPSATWPDTTFGAYNGDGTWNIASSAAAASWQAGLPAAALRGGLWSSGAPAGLFALSLSSAPSNWYTGLGLRCVLPSR